METFETKSASGTVALGRRLAERFQAGACLALVGPLGAGKTTLLRGIADGMHLGDRRLVSSPTFVLVQEYPARVPLYHVDLYRTASAAELRELGLQEMLSAGLVVVEWADKAPEFLPLPRWELAIEITGRRSRRFKLSRLQGA